MGAWVLINDRWYYSARSWEIPPLPWTNLSPPFSIVLGLSFFSASASASEPETNLHCTKLQKLVIEWSPTGIAPTREPLLRDHVPERNYIWCLGIGFTVLGNDPRPKVVILSFGTVPDGTIWLDFWEKREEPSFKWKGGKGSVNTKALLAYLSGLTVTQGRLAGRPFKVLPWQRRFVREAFAPGTKSAALSVARGNGKTALVAGIACTTLDGPLAMPRGETAIVAASFEQARIAFDHVLAFMGEKLDDRSRWKVWDTAQNARIEDKATGARVRCLGSDPRRAHGLAPVLVLADEPAQWPDNTGERMVAALRTAAGKQPFSRFVALGTRPADPEHWFAKLLAGGADYAQSHAARPENTKFRKRTWARANPSLSHMPDLLAAIQSEATVAKRDPALLASFEALRLNLGTEDAEVATLLDAGLWRSIEGEVAIGGPPVWGIDLGTCAAQSAVAAYWPATGALVCISAFPSEPTLAKRGLRDGVGGLYVECARRGELLTLGRHTVDV